MKILLNQGKIETINLVEVEWVRNLREKWINESPTKETEKIVK